MEGERETRAPGRGPIAARLSAPAPQSAAAKGSAEAAKQHLSEVEEANAELLGEKTELEAGLSAALATIAVSQWKVALSTARLQVAERRVERDGARAGASEEDRRRAEEAYDADRRALEAQLRNAQKETKVGDPNSIDPKPSSPKP